MRWQVGHDHPARECWGATQQQWVCSVLLRWPRWWASVSEAAGVSCAGGSMRAPEAHVSERACFVDEALPADERAVHQHDWLAVARAQCVVGAARVPCDVAQEALVAHAHCMACMRSQDSSALVRRRVGACDGCCSRRAHAACALLCMWHPRALLCGVLLHRQVALAAVATTVALAHRAAKTQSTALLVAHGALWRHRCYTSRWRQWSWLPKTTRVCVVKRLSSCDRMVRTASMKPLAVRAVYGSAHHGLSYVLHQGVLRRKHTFTLWLTRQHAPRHTSAAAAAARPAAAAHGVPGGCCLLNTTHQLLRS